ncbi:hypothetical protein [Cohaesibacter haloalkalitolerans]|nr:hypothetical protein [Cohaesibacter haloalkalitolerans]
MSSEAFMGLSIDWTVTIAAFMATNAHGTTGLAAQPFARAQMAKPD